MLHPLEQKLTLQLTSFRSITVAFSGGVDSTAILIMCKNLENAGIISFFVLMDVA